MDGFSDLPYTAVRREHKLAVGYEVFTRSFESLLGVMDFDALGTLFGGLSPEVARAKLASFVGPLEFSLFQKLDHGALLRLFAGQKARATTFVFGNALIAVEMTKYAPDVGLYVPLRLYVRELGPNQTVATYDVPSETIGQFPSAEAFEIARSLDDKVERIIAEALALALRSPRKELST